MVRTNSKDQKLDAFFKPTNQNAGLNTPANEIPSTSLANQISPKESNGSRSSRNDASSESIEVPKPKAKSRYCYSLHSEIIYIHGHKMLWFNLWTCSWTLKVDFFKNTQKYLIEDRFR